RSQHRAHDRRPIFSGSRIVMKAIKQELVGPRPDPTGGSFYQPKSQIARRIFEAVEVPRNPTLWGQNHDPAGMNILFRCGIVGVPESDRIRQSVYRVLLSCEKMPAAGG